MAAGTLYAIALSTFNEVQRVSITQDPALTRPAPFATATEQKPPINILLLGSDSRQPTNQFTTPDELTGFRSDAILVAQISPDREHVTMMSIMRDNWVEIQGHGEAKINAAFSYGGLPLAVNTVENFIGARIDHVALIDFESFKGLTDSLGGVTVHNTVPYTAQNGGGGYTFAEGDITLNGAEALSFVRERYAFSDGDYQRVRNQQAYLKGLMGTLLSKESLSDPGRIVTAFTAVKRYLILDDGLDLNRAIALGTQLSGLRPDGITFFTSPTLGTGTSADGQSTVIVDYDSLEPIRAAFAAGTLHEHAAGLG